MTSDTLSHQEQQHVDRIMGQLGVDVSAEDRRLAADDLKYEMDLHHDVYENSNFVAKPKFVQRKEEHLKQTMKGFTMSSIPKPLYNDVYIKTLKPEEKKSVIITNSVSDMFSNRGIVIDMGRENDFNINDEVFFNLRAVRCRFNLNNETIAVVNYKGILAVA